MVLPNTFYLNQVTNTLQSSPTSDSIGPLQNTWNPIGSAKSKLSSAASGNYIGAAGSLANSIYDGRPVHTTVAKAGLTYLGWGTAAEVADWSTQKLQQITGNKPVLNSFIKWGPIGALVTAIKNR